MLASLPVSCPSRTDGPWSIRPVAKFVGNGLDPFRGISKRNGARPFPTIRLIIPLLPDQKTQSGLQLGCRSEPARVNCRQKVRGGLIPTYESLQINQPPPQIEFLKFTTASCIYERWYYNINNLTSSAFHRKRSSLSGPALPWGRVGAAGVRENRMRLKHPSSTAGGPPSPKGKAKDTSTTASGPHLPWLATGSPRGRLIMNTKIAGEEESAGHVNAYPLQPNRQSGSDRRREQ